MEEENKKDEVAEAPKREVKEEVKAEKPVEEPKKEEKTEAEPAKEEESEPVEVPEKFKKLVEQVEQMTVIELNELVKLLEKKFGVSAQAVAVAPAGGGEGGADAEEKSLFTVELKTAGDQKIAMIKAVKGILGLGLKEAKDMVEGIPTVLKEGVKKEEAEEMKAKIEEAGGSVELK